MFIHDYYIVFHYDYALCPTKSGTPSSIDDFVNSQRIFKILSVADTRDVNEAS